MQVESGVLAILQARVSSSRLPGKVLGDVLGHPMLERQIERILQSSAIQGLCVATSTEASDDPIAALCNSLGVAVSRGSLWDVLDRFHCAAEPFKPRHVVRLTGDCPLLDPAVMDALIEMHLAGDFDYTSNTLEPTYPDGLDVEVVRYSCLQQAWREAKLLSEREHVTPYIKLHPEAFRLGQLRHSKDLSALRWTVDYAADLEFVRRVYEALYPQNPRFRMHDILALLEREPQLSGMNTGVVRDEGYALSLANDRVIQR